MDRESPPAPENPGGDETPGRSRVYSVDSAGGVIEDDYTVTGSGVQLAYGTIEGNYDSAMSVETRVER